MRDAHFLPYVLLVAAACAPAASVERPRAPAGIRADSATVAVLAPGVRHTVLRHAAGPWVVHVLEVDPRACGIALRTAKGGGRVVGRETTSALARSMATALRRPVLAAVNADFFSFDPPGRPEGAQVSAGTLLKSDVRERALLAGGARTAPAFGVDARGRPFIASVRFRGSVRVGGERVPLARVNAPDSAVVLYDRWFGDATPAGAPVEVVLRVVRAAAVGDTAVGVVIAVDTVPGGVVIDSQHLVLAGAAPLLRAAAPGDTLRWIIELEGASAGAAELVGGFPELLRAGRAVHALEFVMPASFSEQRHPRTAVGWDDDGRILLVAVDGRQPGWSDGMTLAELAAYMRALGAIDALNLDGGGSTTVVVAGHVVNRPSDATGERAVANALLVLGPRADECRGPAGTRRSSGPRPAAVGAARSGGTIYASSPGVGPAPRPRGARGRSAPSSCFARLHTVIRFERRTV